MNHIVEINAVKAVEHQILISKLLFPKLSVGDKYPSWDGEILVYSDERSRNKQMRTNIVGRIPVQVKGTKVNSFSEKERKFSLEVDDLRNYLNDFGVLYFLVEMT